MLRHVRPIAFISCSTAFLFFLFLIILSMNLSCYIEEFVLFHRRNCLVMLFLYRRSLFSRFGSLWRARELKPIMGIWGLCRRRVSEIQRQSHWSRNQGASPLKLNTTNCMSQFAPNCNIFHPIFRQTLVQANAILIVIHRKKKQ